MGKCIRLEVCPFFKKIKTLPRTVELLTASYCHRAYSDCARLLVVSKGVRPPDDLFPNDRIEAQRILSQSERQPALTPPTGCQENEE